MISCTCMECGRHLFGDIEQETGLCGKCADKQANRERDRREFEYYHPKTNWDINNAIRHKHS